MPWRKILKLIYPTDIVTLGYLLATGIFIVLSAFKLDDTWSHLVLRFGVLGFVVGIVLIDFLYTSKLVRFIHLFYPLALLSYLYAETDYLNNVFFYDLDPWVSNIELTIFRSHPSIWFSYFLPWNWLSEIMSMAYFSFYVLIFILCYRIYRQNEDDCRYSIFVLCFSFYIYYIIFILFPVAGPQYYFMAPENKAPDGYFFSYIMHYIHLVGERPTAAFPSSHVGIMCLLWYLSIKFDRRLLKWYLPLGIMLIMSTVYLKAHYVVDVIAGILTVPTMYWVSKNTYALIEHAMLQEITIVKLCEEFRDKAIAKFKKLTHRKTKE